MSTRILRCDDSLSTRIQPAECAVLVLGALLRALPSLRDGVIQGGRPRGDPRALRRTRYASLLYNKVFFRMQSVKVIKRPVYTLFFSLLRLLSPVVGV